VTARDHQGDLGVGRRRSGARDDLERAGALDARDRILRSEWQSRRIGAPGRTGEGTHAGQAESLPLDGFEYGQNLWIRTSAI